MGASGPTPLTWLVTAGLCAAAAVQGYPCGSPGKPLHGSVSPRSQLFYAGENVTLACMPGYVRFGQPSRTCTQDGTWEGLMPFCKRNVAYRGSTQGPPPLLGVRNPGEFQSSLATDGDMLTCSRSPRDVAERWWQVRLPSRTRVESVGLVVPPGVNLDLNIFIISLDSLDPSRTDYLQCANFSGVLHDSKRLFRCGSQGLVGEYVYIRDNRRHLDYFTLCEVEVFTFGDLRGCGDPEQPAHGHVARPDADTATYSCQAGYRLAGHRQRRCNRGEWTGQQPVCRKIFCERPPPLENGYLEQGVASRPRLAYNATVQYRCQAGFVMQGGPGLRSCAITGRWSGAMPRCQPLVCPMPPKYENARYELLNGTTRWMAMVQYECLEGYTLNSESGDLVTRCEDDGDWRAVDITCVITPLLGTGSESDIGFESGSGAESGSGSGSGSVAAADDPDASAERGLSVTHEQHEPMSSGVVAGLWVAAVIAIAAMIIIGIFFTRKRVWRRGKRSDPPVSVIPPADIKTYDQVYEPSYQNVFESAPTPSLSTFRAPSQRSSGETERPRGRPVEPPYETLKARLAAGAAADEDDPYEPVAGGRVYDAVAPEGGDSGPYASLAAREPDYETLRAMRGEEGDYDLVPARVEDTAGPEYDQVPPVNTYENCRFVAGTGAHEVPDLLKGAPPSRDHDIPPEILALYAKVIKSKKRNRDEAGDPPPVAAPDSACPSSPGSSTASSYTKNLIEKFNRLAGSEETEAAARSPGGDDRVQYSQICAADGGAEVRRPTDEPVVYSAVRPLPPVPPEH